MFRGVPPESHGVLGNTMAASALRYPSIMDVAHQAGLRTAMFYSWGELRDLAAPDSVSLGYCRAFSFDEDTDAIVCRTAAEYLIAEQPDLTLVYFASPDLVGHSEGWMSRPYLRAIEHTDASIGDLFQTLERAGLRNHFTILTLADHGGHGHEHGSAQAEDLTIPWILSGPGIRRHHAIQTPIAIYDTAPTLAHLLDVSFPEIWTGQPVYEALADGGGQ